jgi:hypothetical protein
VGGDEVTRVHEVWRRGAAVSVVGLLLAGCGGDDGGDAAPETTDAGEAAEDRSVTEVGTELATSFESDFDRDDGWGEAETDDYRVAFTDDGYEMVQNDGRESLWAYAEAGPASVEDSSTTVVVAPDGAADRGYGVLCRLSRAGPSAYYTLSVNGGAGSWAIARWDQGTAAGDVLADGEDEALRGLGEDEAVEVTGTCLGEGDGEPVELAVAVDGEEVGTVTDEDGLAAGLSGIVVVTADAEEPEAPTIFREIEVRGDDQLDVEFEDDLAGPEGGFIELPEDEFGNTISFDGEGLAFELGGNATSPIPVRRIPERGSVEVTLESDLVDGYAGVCLEGAEGDYQFDLTEGGYASVGFAPGEAGDFVVLDEATGAYEPADSHRIAVTWEGDGEGYDLDIAVDGEVIAATEGADDIVDISGVALCGTTAAAAGEGATMSVRFRDVVMVGEG